MKKLLLVLMVVAMASFLLVGCLPGIGGDTGEGEGEGEGEVTTTVEIADSVVLDDKTYVAEGTHEITVTFAAPVVNVFVEITGCSGDYKNAGPGVNVVMFPDPDKKIWTGSGSFAVGSGDDALCCASYVTVTAGECDPNTCIAFPVIVDPVGPFAQLKASTITCPCDTGDQLKLTSDWIVEGTCVDTTGCCGDYCSGLASWTLDIYDEDPFGVCCAPDPCVTAYKSCIGTACPVECLTECDEDFFADDATYVGAADNKNYYVLVSMLDKVGNETKYYGKLVVDTDSIVSFHDYTVDSVTCDWTECDTTDDILGDCLGVPCQLLVEAL